MDCIVHGVAKSQTQLRNFHITSLFSARCAVSSTQMLLNPASHSFYSPLKILLIFPPHHSWGGLPEFLLPIIRVNRPVLTGLLAHSLGWQCAFPSFQLPANSVKQSNLFSNPLSALSSGFKCLECSKVSTNLLEIHSMKFWNFSFDWKSGHSRPHLVSWAVGPHGVSTSHLQMGKKELNKDVLWILISSP